jgi:hypothetical protein
VFGDNESAAGAGTQLMSLFLTLVATCFVGYAMYTFQIRRQAIRRREDAVCLVLSYARESAGVVGLVVTDGFG